MADQNSLDATDIGEKNVFDTTNIDETLDISWVILTQNIHVRITEEKPILTNEIVNNKETESTKSDIEDYISPKYKKLAKSKMVLLAF